MLPSDMANGIEDSLLDKVDGTQRPPRTSYRVTPSQYAVQRFMKRISKQQQQIFAGRQRPPFSEKRFESPEPHMEQYDGECEDLI